MPRMSSAQRAKNILLNRTCEYCNYNDEWMCKRVVNSFPITASDTCSHWEDYKTTHILSQQEIDDLLEAIHSADIEQEDLDKFNNGRFNAGR